MSLKDTKSKGVISTQTFKDLIAESESQTDLVAQAEMNTQTHVITANIESQTNLHKKQHTFSQTFIPQDETTSQTDMLIVDMDDAHHLNIQKPLEIETEIDAKYF